MAGSSRAGRVLAAAAFLTLVFAAARPVPAAISVSGELQRVYAAAPGHRLTGSLRILNRGSTAQTVSIRLRDYLHAPDGSNRFDEPGSHARSCAPWTAVFPRQATIPAGGDLTADFVIQVPDEPALAGSYWCVAIVEPEDEPAAPAGVENAVTVRTVVRYAVQLVVNMEQSGAKTIEIGGGALIERDGRRFLELDVANTGQRWINPEVWAEVYRAQGGYAGRAPSPHRSLFPGCAARYAIPLELTAGEYRALVVLDDQDGEAWGAQYDFEIPPSGLPALAQKPASR